MPRSEFDIIKSLNNRHFSVMWNANTCNDIAIITRFSTATVLEEEKAMASNVCGKQLSKSQCNLNLSAIFRKQHFILLL